jgi:uncharacterized protein YndB with AHSA1/START domain
MTTSPAAEVTLPIAAPPAEVFGHFTDPVRYVRWMGAAAVLDPRPGGRYEVTMSDGFRAAGSFELLEPPHLVIFSWGFADDEAASHAKRQTADGPPAASAMPAGSTRVTVTFAASGDGTRLTLRHDNLPSQQLVTAHQVAWETYLPRLATVVTGADPGPDPHA